MITRIREVRRARGMTLDDVAKACSPPTTPQTIGRLETGTRTVSVGWLNRIASALGVDAAELFGRSLGGLADDHVLELTHTERRRIFNLGYYTWVEQQGVPVEDFDRRKDQSFWRSLTAAAPAWDAMITEMNSEISLRQ